MEFEFGTSRHTEQQEEHHNQDQVPMVYADELFHNGKFLPLKPPPRLQYISSQTSSVSPPTSPSSILKGPFRRWSFNKNNEDDFDPFMVALEKVRNEAGCMDHNNPHKRTRSLSPMRSPSLWPNSNDSLGEKGSHQPAPHVGSHSVEKTYPEKSALEMPASRVRSRPKRPVKPTLTTLPGPRARTPLEDNTKRDGLSSSRKDSKRSNVKETAASGRRKESENNLEPHTGALRRPPEMRDLSLKAIQKAHCARQKDLANRELRRKTLLPYRVPRMFVCLGLGSGGLRDVN